MKQFLFAIVALLFATAAFAQSGYQIRPGDTLQVEVLEDPSLNRSVLVLPDARLIPSSIGGFPNMYIMLLAAVLFPDCRFPNRKSNGKYPKLAL